MGAAANLTQLAVKEVMAGQRAKDHGQCKQSDQSAKPLQKASPHENAVRHIGEMTPSAQLALCFGMVLGRVEVLALLSLMNFAYWRS